MDIFEEAAIQPTIPGNKLNSKMDNKYWYVHAIENYLAVRE